MFILNAMLLDLFHEGEKVKELHRLFLCIVFWKIILDRKPKAYAVDRIFFVFTLCFYTLRMYFENTSESTDDVYTHDFDHKNI
jgi:hypothetical protein